MTNVELLLRWIPAPALDPDPGFAGMTMYFVMPDLIRHPERKQGQQRQLRIGDHKTSLSLDEGRG
jgi:hypothetical protein